MLGTEAALVVVLFGGWEAGGGCCFGTAAVVCGGGGGGNGDRGRFLTSVSTAASSAWRLLLNMSLEMMSMGTGKTIVLFFSAEILFSVWR